MITGTFAKNPYNSGNVMWQMAQKARFYARLGFASLVLSAGMQRSGSTLLYNMLRLMLETNGTEALSCGYIKDIHQLKTGRTYLIKTHHVSRLMGMRARQLFYSYRDVRTALVSQCRKFGGQPDMKFVDFNLAEFRRAKALSAVMVSYERLLSEPSAVVADAARRLSLQVDPMMIALEAGRLYSSGAGRQLLEETLLHPGHVTGTAPDAWRHELPSKLVECINHRYGSWFRECGYPQD